MLAKAGGNNSTGASDLSERPPGGLKRKGLEMVTESSEEAIPGPAPTGSFRFRPGRTAPVRSNGGHGMKVSFSGREREQAGPAGDLGGLVPLVPCHGRDRLFG